VRLKLPTPKSRRRYRDLYEIPDIPAFVLRRQIVRVQHWLSCENNGTFEMALSFFNSLEKIGINRGRKRYFEHLLFRLLIRITSNTVEYRGSCYLWYQLVAYSMVERVIPTKSKRTTWCRGLRNLNLFVLQFADVIPESILDRDFNRFWDPFRRLSPG